ncbi:MAG: hypothetical protein K2P63_10690, partial [Lachnospiraceae bacterium]|nr:hypothetical protein [Lachnospiraceae bacterium]
AYGLAPKYYERVLGRTAARDLTRGTPLSLDAITGGEKLKDTEGERS